MGRVLISDKLADEGLQILELADGVDFDHKPGIDTDELIRILPDYDALIIRSGTKVTEDVLAASDRLRVIGRAGIGVDNVDLAQATARGVIVMNTPEGNAITTAEHAISLMTSLARRIPQATASMKAGQWEKSKFGGRELFNQVLGVVGLGNIGSIVADRAKGLRMQVIAFDPIVTEERAKRLGVELVSLDELLSRADVISIHVPLTNDTRGLIGREQFAQTKDGILVINAARGGIVDEAALLEAIESGKVAGAGLDVFESEPPPADHPLLARDEVIATPHLGAATSQAQLNVAIAVAEQVRDYLTTGIVRNAVNLPPVSAADLEELGPYIALGEKLGLLQGQSCSGIKSVEIICAGEIGELNTKPITLAVLKGLLSPWMGDTVNMVNAPHLASERGIQVIETKADSHPDFRSLITIKVSADSSDQLAAGTIFGRSQPRIVRIDNFMLEAVPDGPALLIRNSDQPGVVGQVGTLLGGAGINISRMQLGLLLEGEHSLQLLNVNPKPGPDVITALNSIVAIESVHVLDLGPQAG